MTTTTEKCVCLTAEDATLPHHASCRPDSGVTNAARDLAELAAFRDIDTALMCLRQLSRPARGRR